MQLSCSYSPTVQAIAQFSAVRGLVPHVVPLSLWVNVGSVEQISDTMKPYDDSKASFLYVVKLLVSSERSKCKTYRDTVLHIIGLLFTAQTVQNGVTYREVMRGVALVCKALLDTGSLAKIPVHGRCMTIVNALKKC